MITTFCKQIYPSCQCSLKQFFSPNDEPIFHVKENFLFSLNFVCYQIFTETRIRSHLESNPKGLESESDETYKAESESLFDQNHSLQQHWW